MTQSEIKSKYSGIQTDFELAYHYSCLFLCLLSIAEEAAGIELDFITERKTCLEKGWLLKDYTCKDQTAMLSYWTGKKWARRIVQTLPAEILQNQYTVQKWYNRQTKYTHFKRRYFDSLENSKTVANGKILEYYIYTMED